MFSVTEKKKSRNYVKNVHFHVEPVFPFRLVDLALKPPGSNSLCSTRHSLYAFFGFLFHISSHTVEWIWQIIKWPTTQTQIQIQIRIQGLQRKRQGE